MASNCQMLLMCKVLQNSNMTPPHHHHTCGFRWTGSALNSRRPTWYPQNWWEPKQKFFCRTSWDSRVGSQDLSQLPSSNVQLANCMVIHSLPNNRPSFGENDFFVARLDCKEFTHAPNLWLGSELCFVPTVKYPSSIFFPSSLPNSTHIYSLRFLLWTKWFAAELSNHEVIFGSWDFVARLSRRPRHLASIIPW